MRSAVKIISLLIILGAAVLGILTHGYWQEYLKYKFSAPLPNGAGNFLAEKIEPDRIIVPKLNISVPVVHVEERNEEAFQEGLRSGVVRYPGTAEIGKPGNAFIFGHSSDYIWAKGGYKTVFALLPELEEGDIIIASDREGNKFEYAVKETVIVDPGAVKYLDQHDFRDKDQNLVDEKSGIAR